MEKGRELPLGLPEPGRSSHGGARPGAGRPPGALNRASREIAAYLRRTEGDAIVNNYRFCMRPVLIDPEELERLRDFLKCSRLEAAEFYAKMCEKTFPYVYPRLAQLEVKPPGAPNLGWDLDIDGDGEEVTELPDDEPAELPAPTAAAPQNGDNSGEDR